MTVAAVILAAGSSLRFGSPKAAVRIGSRTMLEVVVDTATAAGLTPVVVVAPPALAVPESAIVVRNAAPEAGLSRSLRLGIGAIPPDCAAAVVLLADQPTVSVDHLRALDGWRGGTPVVATRSSGVLGPPVLLEREVFALVDDTSGDSGLRDLLRREPELVTPVDHPGLVDVHRPDARVRLTARRP